MNYKEVNSTGQLDKIDHLSFSVDKGVLLFKHSTRCSVSGMIWDRFKRKWTSGEEEMPVYYLDILQYRNVSDEIARRYGIVHESPQVLLIKEGKCIYHASHMAIRPAELNDLVHG